MSGRLKYSHTETRLDNESIRTNYENDLHILIVKKFFANLRMHTKNMKKESTS